MLLHAGPPHVTVMRSHMRVIVNNTKTQTCTHTCIYTYTMDALENTNTNTHTHTHTYIHAEALVWKCGTVGEGKAHFEELSDLADKGGAQFERIKRRVDFHKAYNMNATEKYFNEKNGGCELVGNGSCNYEKVTMSCGCTCMQRIHRRTPADPLAHQADRTRRRACAYVSDGSIYILCGNCFAHARSWIHLHTHTDTCTHTHTHTHTHTYTGHS